MCRSLVYLMGSNFHGVQIFVDFVGSLHPRKFYFALIFGARYFALIFYLHLIDPLYRKNKEAAAEINFGTWPIILPSSLICNSYSKWIKSIACLSHTIERFNMASLPNLLINHITESYSKDIAIFRARWDACAGAVKYNYATKI